MGKVGLKGTFEEEKHGERCERRGESYEEDSFLALIQPDIGGYSKRNKHKNGAVQSCTTPFFLFKKKHFTFAKSVMLCLQTYRLRIAEASVDWSEES